MNANFGTPTNTKFKYVQKERNKAKLEDFHSHTPSNLSGANNINDIKFDNQFGSLLKKNNTKSGLLNFKQKYNQVMDDFFDAAPYSVVNTSGITKRSEKTYSSKGKNIPNGDILKLKQNFFTQFPHHMDFFDNNKQGNERSTF